LQGKGVRLGIVGILDEEKGQHIAIEYFRDVLKNHPEATLHIYGDKEGPYKKRLLEMIRKYSLENTVRMHGFVKDSKAIYLDMDIMLMCSRSEGFGRVTAEAMQYGIPVIGYDSGGTSEIIEEGRNGYLFKDKEEFLKAVEQLLDSEKHYQEMSEYAFRNAHERFSKERYCRHIQDFVTRICSSSSVS
jgi:glycosyltransferase involved in cell wall biosynthesis